MVVEVLDVVVVVGTVLVAHVDDVVEVGIAGDVLEILPVEGRL